MSIFIITNQSNGITYIVNSKEECLATVTSLRQEYKDMDFKVGEASEADGYVHWFDSGHEQDMLK